MKIHNRQLEQRPGRATSDHEARTHEASHSPRWEHGLSVIHRVLLLAILLLAPGSALRAADEIELYYTDEFHWRWSDAGSGGTLGATFYAPKIPSGLSMFGFGDRAVQGTGAAPRKGMLVGKALEASAFAHPVSFTFLWHDVGSGATNNARFFRPVPPAGYVSLGDVCEYVSRPALTSVVCVREDLVVEATIGDKIYDDSGTGAETDFSAWAIQAPNDAIDLGTYVANGGSHGAPNVTVYCLKKSAIKALPAPSQSQLETLIFFHGPVVKMHPDEAYLPDDPAAMLDHPNTTLQWMTVENDDRDDSDDPPFSKTVLGSLPTSSATILEDVQAALSHPQAEDGNFRYIVDFPESLASGNLDRAKSYVRVQPYQGSQIELQFWIFYPWNGPGKATAQASVGGVFGTDLSFNPTGTVGVHYSDWENIRVRLTNRNVHDLGFYSMTSVVVSRHSGDEEVLAHGPYRDSRLQDQSGSPIIYSAKDSHAHYFRPGLQYYAVVAAGGTPEPPVVPVPPNLATYAISTFDLPADGGEEFKVWQGGNTEIVSSAWPSVETTDPNWLFFAGKWGDYTENAHPVSVPPILNPAYIPEVTPLYLFDGYTYTTVEVGNGKPGLLKRNEWSVRCPENPKLGLLRPSFGTLSPTFDPDVTSYTLSNPNDLTELHLLTQAATHASEVEVWTNNNLARLMPSGKLLGKQSHLLRLTRSTNTITIKVTAPPVSGCPETVRTYEVTVDAPVSPQMQPELAWTTTGDSNWFEQTSVSHDGEDAARSGAILDSQESSLVTRVTGPGQLSFWWKVSSEEGFDFLRLEVDGVGATTAISGEVDWQRVTVAIPSGLHQISWDYTKDSSVTEGQDAGWVDEVSFTGPFPLLSPTDTVYGGRLEGTQFNLGTPGRFVPGNNGWLASGEPAHAIDGAAPKYLNTGKENSGLVVTPATSSSIARNITIWTANDLPERDPASYALYGTNSPLGTGPFDLDQFTLIASGDLALPAARNPSGAPLDPENSQTVFFDHSVAYMSYMIVFPTLKNSASANSVQIGEIQIGGTAAPNLGDGLVNYWNFDNNLTDHAPLVTGNTSTVTDSGTFDGANGTGGISYTASGRFGSSIEQNGANGGNRNDGFVEILRSADTLFGANATNPGSPNTVTISAWIEAEAFDSAFQTVLSHGEGSQYRIARKGSNEVIAYAGGSPDIPGVVEGPNIAQGTGWHHVVAISEGGVSTRLWVDGTLVATGAAPVIDDSRGGGSLNLNIGSNPNTGTQNREWFGRIDDVAMWNRALTAVEVESLHLGGLADLSLGDLTTPLRSFASWAAANLPPGEDTSFNGTIDNELVSNGIRYAFDNAAIESPESGVITSPADVPDDVILILEYTDDLKTWAPAVTWTNGVPVVTDPFSVTIENGFVTDTSTDTKSFWRYRVVLAQP